MFNSGGGRIAPDSAAKKARSMKGGLSSIWAIHPLLHCSKEYKCDGNHRIALGLKVLFRMEHAARPEVFLRHPYLCNEAGRSPQNKT